MYGIVLKNNKYLLQENNYYLLADTGRPTAGLSHLAPAEGLFASLAIYLSYLGKMKDWKQLLWGKIGY